MGNLLKDLRYGVRMLAKNPGFTAVVVLCLALGIGANTAIFTLIDNLLLRRLPVENPEQLVILSDPGSSGVSIGSQGGERSLYSYPEYVHLRNHNQVFSGMFASESGQARVKVSLDGSSDAQEQIGSRLVTGGYFNVLGIHALLGRVFTTDDDKSPGANPIAVISYNYWKRRFALDPSVIGKTLKVHDTIFTVVGVTPQGFSGESVGGSPDIYFPMMMQGQVIAGRQWLTQSKSVMEKVMWLHIFGRLKPGVTLQQADASMNVAFQQMLVSELGSKMTESERRDYLDQKIKASDGSTGVSGLRESFREPLLVLMSLVGLVLLIACANVANLLLVRATARQKEIAVRLALGAGRGRLVRQLLTESVFLALLGGALGALLASWADGVLLRLVAAGNNSILLDLHPDARILGFTLVVSLFTGILFGLAPAWRSTHMDLAPVLKDAARGTSAGRSRFGLGKILVVAQVAMSLLMLIGAGLFVRSLQKLMSADLGYNPDKLLLVRIDPVPSGYQGAAVTRLYQQLLERFKAIPGVRAATLSENGLFSHSESGDPISIQGFTPKSGQNMNARFDQVGPNYFATVGIPILMGRDVSPDDSGNAPRVGMINQTMAQYYFGKENPIGKQITDEYPDNRESFQVVGVVADAKYNNLREETPRRFYVPYFNPIIPGGAANFEIRTFANPSSVTEAIRHEINSVDKSLTVTDVNTMGELVDDSLGRDKLVAKLSSIFGALALLLASIGLYGVMAYAVARRTNEIGVRIALGAARANVVWLVLRETLWMVAIGIAIGLPAALAATRLISSRLYGLSATDPLTIIGAALVMLVVAMLAGFIPARRASRVDPMVALRYE
jgi:putative ABC transport system permease protein